MKKKIIKSYFFNQSRPAPILFPFSKRAVRYRKNKHLLTHKRSGMNISVRFYKEYILHKSLYNMWSSYSQQFIGGFLHSHYKNTLSLSLPKLNTYINTLYAWYLTKDISTHIMFSKLSKYSSTGLLSSHFVHFLTKKNISYQNRSKYKVELRNLNSMYLYIYLNTLLCYKYFSAMEQDLYFFTVNAAHKSINYDEDFIPTVTNWINTPRNDNSSTYGYINPLDFTLEDQHELYTNKYNITDIIYNTDIALRPNLLQSVSLTKPNLYRITANISLYSSTCLNYNVMVAQWDYIHKLSYTYKNL